MFHTFAVQKQTRPLWYALTGSKERHKNINKEGKRVKSKRLNRTTSDPRFESPPGDNDRLALQLTACRVDNWYKCVNMILLLRQSKKEQSIQLYYESRLKPFSLVRDKDKC